MLTEKFSDYHLLALKSKILLPDEFLRAGVYSRQRWRRVQHLANEIGLAGGKNSYKNLQQRVRPFHDIQIGDVVIVCDSNLPRKQSKRESLNY